MHLLKFHFVSLVTLNRFYYIFNLLASSIIGNSNTLLNKIYRSYLTELMQI